MSARELSNSELEEFRRCPRMHWLKNVQRLAPIEPPSPLKAAEIGTRIHTGLERYYAGEPAESILRDLRAEAEAEGPADEIKAATLVLAALEGYFDWLSETGEDQALEFLAVEQVFSRTLEGCSEPVSLIGKLDALVRLPHGEIAALDHKSTGYQLSVKIPVLVRAPQIPHYLWLLQPVFPARILLLNLLRQSLRTERSSGPFYTRHTATRNTRELEAFEAHVRETAEAVLTAYRRESVPPPVPGEDCHWRCPFFRVCPSFDNGDDIEFLLETNYAEADPMARYRGKERNAHG